MTVLDQCQDAVAASAVIKQLTTEKKNAVLRDMVEAIETHLDSIIAANAEDVAAAREAGTSATLVDRLTLTERRAAGLTAAIRTIIDLPDPGGRVVEGWTRPNGLRIERVLEPLGVIAVIYEARPNVTAEVAALCLKSGNCAILRGSSTAMRTNRAIMAALDAALARHPGVPAAAVQLVDDPSREAALELMRAKGFVDLLVPRGGPELIASVERNATVPTVIDGAGNCHLYIDATARPEMATEVVVNAKTSRPSVCNAIETLLVHQDLVTDWLPQALDELAAAGVEIRGCAQVRDAWPKAVEATVDDWATEYLDLVLAVRVVSDVDEAIAHIREWGTGNAEGIVVQDIAVANRFAREVDSGSVFVNASPRYSDGGEFGYGVEIGVSTQKLHARGPMGLASLMTAKNVVWGSGQTRTVA
ncbi:glutamate-5-semialdehyde dehydrogenase [Amycolatopsis xylanica]|uniref:Gamma-glutamyl phosphate reductase n=1 Tax=Amycolatopsis xylanica TaxID=589385 RepID=A0A1H3PLV4_9PSEU|nr:glutamate-5-semialdehyde dehydrogenase [Amycolatopsis xylanica]SDZ01920.1 glutamate-5-semialdehyde dehydrogenase [Amycolatopsis xylanica]